MPDAAEIARRSAQLFRALPRRARRRDRAPARRGIRASSLYDCHSIRSIIPRLFEGELPTMNIGTNSGAACDMDLAEPIDGDRLAPAASPPSSTAASRAAASRATTAQPGSGVHAVQMELACRGYMREPVGPVDESNWPVPYDPATPPTIARHAARDPGNLPALRQRRQHEAPHDPHRQRPHHPRAARHRALRQELADRSAAAHAHEQPRSGGGGEAGRAGGLWRHRPGRARLGELRPHRRRAAQARGRRDAAGAVGQAGRRLPHACRRAARADRQLQPRAALGDAGSTSTSSIARA